MPLKDDHVRRAWMVAKSVAGDRALIGQLLRYGITGGGLTVFSAGVYWLLAKPANLPEQIANLASWAMSVMAGYTIHSSWSFRGHGTRRDAARMRVRFLMSALLSLGLNAFWVWVFVKLLDGAEWWPIPAMALVTPLVIFPINRLWVFR